MSIVIEDPQPEQLARTLAAAEDTSIESVSARASCCLSAMTLSRPILRSVDLQDG